MLPTPSTCPCTMWPPKRESARIGRSRFKRLPRSIERKVVRSSVSCDSSAVKLSALNERAVKHTPFTAMLEPNPMSSITLAARTRIVRKSRESSSSTTCPTSSMIPVNIRSDHQIGPDAFAGEMQWQSISERFESVASDRGSFTSSEDFRRYKRDYFINDSALQGVESEIRSAFENEALNFTSVQLVGQRLQAVAKDQESWCGINA